MILKIHMFVIYVKLSTKKVSSGLAVYLVKRIFVESVLMNAEMIHLCVLTCTTLSKEKIVMVTIVFIAMKTQEMSYLPARSVFMTSVLNVKRNQALDALRTIS